MKWFKRIVEHYKDRRLAQHCGLEVKDVCVHESDSQLEAFKQTVGFDTSKGGDWFMCIKCGEFYR